MHHSKRPLTAAARADKDFVLQIVLSVGGLNQLEMHFSTALLASRSRRRLDECAHGRSFLPKKSLADLTLGPKPSLVGTISPPSS